MNIEEYIVLDKAIADDDAQASESARAGIYKRWEFGKAMVKERKGKQLPKGRLDELCEATGNSKTELWFRMQFAEAYPTEDEVLTAISTLGSWTQIKKSLRKPPQPGTPKPPTPPARNEKAEEITALREQGRTRAEIAAELGVGERTVRRELEYDALVEAAVEDAVPIPWDSIPGNQRDKLERAKVTIRKQLEKEYRTRLLAEVDQYRAKLNADYTTYKAKLDATAERQRIQRDDEVQRARQTIDVYRARGLITPRDYDLIRSCLHPDSRVSVSVEKLAEAFRLFNDVKVKTLLVKESGS